MANAQTNRRVTRSEDVQEALRLQLTASAGRAEFTSMVLADELGTVIASTGNSEVGEELAAISPILSPGMKTWRGDVHTNRGKVKLVIAPVTVENNVLYLSATHGRESLITQELFISGRGVTRILA